jgi:hypothetical protein
MVCLAGPPWARFAGSRASGRAIPNRGRTHPGDAFGEARQRLDDHLDLKPRAPGRPPTVQGNEATRAPTASPTTVLPEYTEALWSRMQIEPLSTRRWKTRVELATAIFEYIGAFAASAKPGRAHKAGRRHTASARGPHHPPAGPVCGGRPVPRPGRPPPTAAHVRPAPSTNAVSACATSTWNEMTMMPGRGASTSLIPSCRAMTQPLEVRQYGE